MDELAELTLDVQDFNDVILLRGWTIDQEYSGDGLVTWYYPPSGIGTDDVDVEPVTRIWVTPADGGEWVHTVLVGTTEEFVLAPDEFIEELERIESYRAGDPVPSFE